VAAKPWRAPAAEQMLIGNAPSGPLFAEVSAAAVSGADPLPHNAFKVPLARRTLERALATATGLPVREGA